MEKISEIDKEKAEKLIVELLKSTYDLGFDCSIYCTSSEFPKDRKDIAVIEYIITDGEDDERCHFKGYIAYDGGNKIFELYDTDIMPKFDNNWLLSAHVFNGLLIVITKEREFIKKLSELGVHD